MKVIRKVKGPVVRGPFVAIGQRQIGKALSTLCAVTELDGLPDELKLGLNDLPSKDRDDENAVWLSSCSWVSSRKVGKFTLLRLDDALRTKKVKMLKHVTFVRSSDGHKFVGDVIMPGDWSQGQKQPRCVGVLGAKNWPHPRIESKEVHEANGEPARNRNVVAKLLLKGKH